MKDRKFFEKATDVRCETEVSFTDREVGDSPHHLCMHDWLVYLASFITCRNNKGNLGLEY